MKPIHTNLRTIRQIFQQDKYVIPEYQRPYTWDEDKCGQLWDDLINFWDDNYAQKDRGKMGREGYFLGTIVLHKDPNSQNSFSVVDGQQRLISLSLLIKAFYERVMTSKALIECLLQKHPTTGERLNKPRIKSEVLYQDNEALEDIILGKKDQEKDDGEKNYSQIHFEKNYQALRERIKDWVDDKETDTDKLVESLIITLLDQVDLLVIECDSQEDAFTIFETINDRGTPLNDSDIFKIKIYKGCLEGLKQEDQTLKKLEKEKKAKSDDIVQRWNNLKDHLWLFRIYMHILRAEKKVTSSEIGLRAFFAKRDIGKEYEAIMSILERLNYINQEEWNIPSSINKWWKILQAFPNEFWYFPLCVFLHQKLNAVWVEDRGDIIIKPSSDVADEFKELIKWTVRYFYIRGVNRNSVNAVKDTTYKVCRAIYHGQSYQEIYKENLSEENNDFKEFKRIIEGDSPLRRYGKGIVLIGAALNEQQNEDAFCELLSKKFHIEHILPRKWNHYDGWDDESYKRDLNRLGNLVPCEWNINIAARDEFFSRKQKRYEQSKVQDLLELSEKKPDTWKPEDLEERDKKIRKRLLEFFLPVSYL